MEGNLRYLPPFFVESRGSFGQESEAEKKTQSKTKTN